MGANGSNQSAFNAITPSSSSLVIVRNYNLTVIGSAGVGKSALTVRFMQDRFTDEYDPTIEDSYTKLCEFDNQKARIGVLDTAGHYEYHTMRELFMRSASGDGFMLVFSLVDASSFAEINTFRKQILGVKDCTTLPMLLVGNKSDLVMERQVPLEEVEKFSRSVGIPYIECSAKLNRHVIDAFYELVRVVRKCQGKEH